MKTCLFLSLLLTSLIGSSSGMGCEKLYFKDGSIDFHETVDNEPNPLRIKELHTLLQHQTTSRFSYRPKGILIDLPYSNRVFVDPNFIKEENYKDALVQFTKIDTAVNVICFSDSFTFEHFGAILSSIKNISTLTLFGLKNSCFAIPEVFWIGNSYGTVMLISCKQGPFFESWQNVEKLLKKHRLELGKNLFPFRFVTNDSNPWSILQAENIASYNEWQRYAKEKQNSLPKELRQYTNRLFQ